MAKSRRYRFTGSVIMFWFLCMTIVAIPLAIIYLLEGTMVIEEETDDVKGFIQAPKSGRLD